MVIRPGLIYGIYIMFILLACNTGESVSENDLTHVSRYVLDEDDNYLLAIKGSSNEIYLGEDILIWKDTEQGRSYFGKNGKLMFKIDYLDDGFEILREDKFLLKVRTNYEDKVKIARNRDLVHDWELKRKEDRIDIEFSNSNLAEISWRALEENELVFDQFRFFGFSGSLAPGVWAIMDYSKVEAAVLINELVKEENRHN